MANIDEFTLSIWRTLKRHYNYRTDRELMELAEEISEVATIAAASAISMIAAMQAGDKVRRARNRRRNFDRARRRGKFPAVGYDAEFAEAMARASRVKPKSRWI